MSLDLSRKDIKEYSLLGAIRSYCEGGIGKVDGIAKECHDTLQARHVQKASGLLVPNEIFGLRKNWRRDLNTGTFNQGGAFVQTTVPDEVVPVLRNRLCTQRLGARVLSGLEGNVAIPRQTATATAYSLPEQGTTTASTPNIDQILLTPHRVSAHTSYSRQLVLQSSVSVENFIQDDLALVLATKIDYLCLQGQGAGSEPTGILNTTGIGSLSFGGTATWAEVVSFEQALASANADSGKLGFITTPAVRNRWKAVAKTGIGVTSVTPVFLWPEVSPFSDGSGDGVVNGYRSAATNQVLRDLVFFGSFSDLVIGQFGDGIEVIVDPYTKAQSATINIDVHSFIDVAIRHAASFCVSNDSGAQ